jgi:hypothetical protein
MTGVNTARGESSFSNASGFSTFSALSQLSLALGKHVSTYASYTAYFYEVPADALTVAVPGRMARQMVSVGLNFYVPIYEKVRRGQ